MMPEGSIFIIYFFFNFSEQTIDGNAEKYASIGVMFEKKS